nr:WYL domain-containing protein [Zhihengliuella flava]
MTVREPVWAPLTRAANAQSGVSFRYRRVDGTESDRRVLPWGLGQRFGLWYLIGFDLDRQAERVFRLSRIVSRVSDAVVPEGHERPAGFSPSDYLARLSPERSMTTARVRLPAGRGQDIRHRAISTESTGHGDDVVTYQFHDAESAASRLAMLGPEVKVLAPDTLREAVLRRWRGALEAHTASIPEYKLRKTIPTGRSSGTLMAARALSIVAYVQQHGAVSRGDLCREFGINESTLTSDLKRISFLGPEDVSLGIRLDVDFEADPVQITVPPEFSAPLTLTLNEALVVVVGLRWLAASGHSQKDAAASALTKLTAATAHLPVLDAIELRPRADDDSGISRTLRDAVHARSCLWIDYYHPGRDEISGRVIEPIQILESGHVAYVLAFCRERQDLRVFRHDRIVGFDTLEETFALDERHERSASLAERIYAPRDEDDDVVLAFADHLEEVFRDHSPRGVAVTREQPPRFIGQVALAGPAQARRLVAEHGGDVVVTEPEQLVQETVQWLRAACAAASEEETS